MNFESAYRPYAASAALDPKSIRDIMPHPKANPGDNQRFIIYTHDGDAVVCVKL